MTFSETTVMNSLMDKIAKRCRIKSAKQKKNQNQQILSKPILSKNGYFNENMEGLTYEPNSRIDGKT